MRLLSKVVAGGVASVVVAAAAMAQQGKPAAPSAPPPASQRPLPTLNITVPQRDRDAALAYYRDEAAAGRCPAPLVRSGKSCGAPPAGGRAWKIDQPLPEGVKAEAPPPALIAKLGASPAGYQYARIGTDIVIIGVGTRAVAALVVDLSKM